MITVAAGTGSVAGRDRSIDRAGLGDIAFSFSLQPIKETSTRPALIVNAGFKTKTGISPFRIDPERELPTGSGYNSARIGLNLIKGVDPAVVYGGFGFIYNMPENVNRTIRASAPGQTGTQTIFFKGVDPGDAFSFNLGMAYALSYTVSINFQYMQTYTLASRVYTDKGASFVPNSILNSALLKMGAGITAGKNIPVNLGVYIGLTEDAPDYILEFRVPVKF
jgi:hypothetical protein